MSTNNNNAMVAMLFRAVTALQSIAVKMQLSSIRAAMLNFLHSYAALPQPQNKDLVQIALPHLSSTIANPLPLYCSLIYLFLITRLLACERIAPPYNLSVIGMRSTYFSYLQINRRQS